ncbi:hypothetical protein D9756_008280 [Leucocoprinus leucothites]|uniref:Uncharacterized protein n=1 Tax=Leucocoprinus leucothites TaxID=201217 RepID=A0A8H5D028_9AGAR|nr:hypothetical protein D9756_008280 [Leucoagaricus leucothites]
MNIAACKRARDSTETRQKHSNTPRRLARNFNLRHATRPPLAPTRFYSTHLFRIGSTSSAGFDKVRVGMDIKVMGEDKVALGSGGISTFDRKNKQWAPQNTWVLELARSNSGLSSLGDGLLSAVKKHKTHHWSIEPSLKGITLTEYEGHLRTLNCKAMRYDKWLMQHTTDSSGTEHEYENHLSEFCRSDSLAIRFVYNALACFINEKTPVTEWQWDENDYEYVASLAQALGHNKSLGMKELVWGSRPNTSIEWTKEKAFVAYAVCVYMRKKEERVKAGLADEDEEADTMNDKTVLRSMLNLKNRENPFAWMDNSRCGL